MDYSGQHTDDLVLSEIGQRLSSARLSRNLTQVGFAREAGVSKSTVQRLEAGGSIQLTSFIRLLRALDLLDRLPALLPQGGPEPMDLLRRRGQARQRARPREDHSHEPWTWAEDA